MTVNDIFGDYFLSDTTPEPTPWFAWYPVKLVNGKWAWLKWVGRIIDERPSMYLGLLPDYYYFEIKDNKP